MTVTTFDLRSSVVRQFAASRVVPRRLFAEVPATAPVRPGARRSPFKIGGRGNSASWPRPRATNRPDTAKRETISLEQAIVLISGRPMLAMAVCEGEVR